MSTGPPAQGKTSKTLFRPVNFSVFYLELYKNKFKNLIWTSKFKFSFQGQITWQLSPIHNLGTGWTALWESSLFEYSAMR